MEEGSWITVCGSAAPALEQELARVVTEKIQAGVYQRDEIRRIEKLDLSVSKGRLDISDDTLDKLRRLCQLWDIDIRSAEITSHRKFIGPFIVAAKRLVYPVLRTFLKDTLSQQRDFNATVISLLSKKG